MDAGFDEGIGRGRGEQWQPNPLANDAISGKPLESFPSRQHTQLTRGRRMRFVKRVEPAWNNGWRRACCEGMRPQVEACC
jgi:hypothetical protein